MDKKLSSPEFIEKLNLGDDESMSFLIKTYTSHLINAGLGLGLDPSHCEDVVHDTWSTFFTVVKRFEGRSHIRTFLFGIFYNKVFEFRRMRKKIEKCDQIEDIIDEKFIEDGHYRQHQMGPEQYSHGLDMMKIIETCISKLPLLQRMVFMMKIVEEYESDEICNTLDISATNLRQLLFRGKNRLKSCIDSKIKK